MHVGNEKSNSVWESELINQSATKPNPRDPYATREAFIRSKYQSKQFLSPPKQADVVSEGVASKTWSKDAATSLLRESVHSRSIVDVLRALAADADVSGLSVTPEETSPLMAAIRNENLEATVLLIICGANINQAASTTDLETPLGVALGMFPNYFSGGLGPNLGEFTGGIRDICIYILRRNEMQSQHVRPLKSGDHAGAQRKEGSSNQSIRSSEGNLAHSDQSKKSTAMSAVSQSIKALSPTSFLHGSKSGKNSPDPSDTKSKTTGPVKIVSSDDLSTSRSDGRNLIASTPIGRSRSISGDTSSGSPRASAQQRNADASASRQNATSPLLVPFDSQKHRRGSSTAQPTHVSGAGHSSDRDSADARISSSDGSDSGTPFKHLSTAGSKISQKMRTAFHSTEFLFPGTAAGHGHLFSSSAPGSHQDRSDSDTSSNYKSEKGTNLRPSDLLGEENKE